MTILSSAIRAVLLAMLLTLAAAQAADGPAPAIEPVEGHPVVVWNRTITELRAGIDELTIEERAARITRRIEALSDEALARPLVIRPVTFSGLESAMISAGPDLVMVLTAKDLAPGEDLDLVAKAAAGHLREIFDARLEQRRPEVLLRGGIWLAVASLVLGLVLWLVVRTQRLIGRRIDAMHPELPRMAGIDPAPVLRGGARLVVRALAWLAAGFAVYAWLAAVLAQFPYTRPLAGVLGNHLLAFGRFVLDGVIHALPGLGMVAVIVLLTRMLARALDSFCSSVEDGSIVIGWMQPETAKATRRIAGIVLWLFAMTVAYPYIPGSSSEAFKGVSVFAGLLLTLGSAGMVNQMMSGLVVVYSRMMKPGDMIKVGEVAGQVTELGFLSTKVRTPLGHEVTMPNAILVGTSVSNFSRFDPAVGPVIAAVVTIGYDTPWRQVHALLELAASRTEGIARSAKPEIIQTALSDFYVEYQLRCRIERVEERVAVLSRLHAQIQDAFNEFGVQIMSPHFQRQPEQPVLVPPGKHAPAPAAAV